MTVTLTPIPFDTSLFGAASVTTFVRFRDDNNFISVVRSAGVVYLKKTATDQYNTSKNDHALPAAALIGGSFRTSGGVDIEVLGENSAGIVPYTVYDSVNDRYRYTTGQSIATLAALAADTDISPDGNHLAIKTGNTVQIFDLTTGPAGATQIFTAAQGAQGSLEYSPDGNYLAVLSNSGVKIYKRVGNVYTDLTPTIIAMSGGTIKIEWRPDSQQIIVPSSAGDLRIINKTGTDTFVYNSANDISIGGGRLFARFIGSADKFLLALSSGSLLPRMFQVVGATLVEVPTGLTISAVNELAVSRTDRSLIAVGFAGTQPAPNVALYRVSGDLTLDATGDVVGKKAKAGGLVYHGNDTSAEEVIPMRAGVITLRSPPLSMAAEVADYTAIVGNVIGKKMTATGLSIAGISVMDTNIINKRMTAQGQLTIAGTVIGDLVNKAMVTDSLLEFIKLEVAADFVGKKGSLDGQVETILALSADFAGKKGEIKCLVAVGSTFWAEFVGKKGSLNGNLYNPFQLTGTFVGQKGSFAAFLEEYEGQLTGNFDGKKGSLGAELYNPIVLFADIVGKKGSLGADISNLLGVNASFVGKKGMLDGYISRGQRVDAAFLGKRGSMGADLTVNYPPNEAIISATLKKFNSSMVGKPSSRAVITYLLFGN